MIGRVSRKIENRLVRLDAMIAANQVRFALAGWFDRLIALTLLLVVLGQLHASLADRPLIFAAVSVAGAAAVAGATIARAALLRLDFHASEGVMAADALSPNSRGRYLIAVHAVAAGITLACALIGRPATGGLALAGYAVGAFSYHAARRMIGTTGFSRPSRFSRSARAYLNTPWAAALAGAFVVLLLLIPGTSATGAIPVLTLLASGAAAFALTSIDEQVVRFMTLSGYGPARIVRRHAAPLLVFLALALPGALAVSRHAEAAVIAGLGGTALALMTARILAYRVYARRTADVVISFGVVLCGIAALQAPALLPVILLAIFGQLYRRSAPATWMLA